ncbi:MAG: glutathione S-transferase family protein [Alphaproteobacteria bacterium]|jgi:glutathione S-transferase|nr:glutathione S-transferase family protein [Alphaproteobacteria bacterium]MBT4083348.1 glutathione S-transferase family protein [Alphaproteobacteria bacterium]MBT4543000.1 glutathione S-transferase family protein [Alphaproteobacteria bacterium]MBT5920219.1 glutathione S-transferase family protein [Alphaproteobacteria bacterium]MBT6387993.1 glutathione S-transferase family protein [Alphaproteobacteria bacterium]
MPELKLIIGNRNYSSWSLRAWLAMRQAGLEFREEMVPLDLPDTRQRLREHSDAGRVPVLYHGELKIWDTLAIVEYLAETFPDRHWWPENAADRAMARSVSAEMHSGFAALRSEIPMNIRATNRKVDLSPAAEVDIERILALWQSCLDRNIAGGPFLFGEFCAADAMFAPLVSRFHTYGIDLNDRLQSWSDAVWTSEGMVWWRDASDQESWTIPGEEVGI